MKAAQLADLRDRLAKGGVVVFAGAGVSAAGGLPTWSALAANAVNDFKDSLTSEEVEAASQLMQQSKLIDVFSLLHRKSPQTFRKLIEKQLDTTGRPVPAVAQAIAALRPELHAVLTTNIDNFIERAFLGEWPIHYGAPPSDIGQRGHYIWKVHGTSASYASWVFLRQEYDRVMARDSLTQKMLEHIYHSQTLLFIGTSLSDDNMEMLFREARAKLDAQPPTHYAFLAKGTLAAHRREELERSGIVVIEYEKDPTHSGLLNELKSLRSGSPLV